MEKPPQSFDVCIVCALPEEARAFLKVVQQQCKVAFEKHISTQYKYDYQLTTIKNDKGEPLNLHVSWLPRYGPQEMTLHLSRVLEECQPRIAIMTGICAGDAQRVQLGDLVVAERTFAYDNGKFTLDEHGRKVHLHDTLTYQLDANILQFLGLFDEWKPLVARLQRPPSPSEQHKKRKIACHIKAMASGSAVRADNPFEDVRAPVRGTVAIDMEGAAFGLVMSRHPLIPWLVIKGVCDYADRGKNDSVHDYAARASALYALSFIRAYVTHERLPRPNGSSFSSGARPSGVWNVPHARNPHFTGRDELLDRLHQQLTPTEQNDPARFRRIALTQPQAIKGLGGVGKTQIAVEYAYRSREQGRFTHILWVNAASEETIIASFVTIAELLPTFSAKNETDQRKLVEAVKRWLEQCEQRWLLIFDNADDLPIIQEHVPQSGNGSVLLTTRTNAVGSLGASSIEVENMGLIEGTEFLLHRVQRQQASDEERDEAINVVIALDCFPLALDQAGAYIEETGCGFIEYLKVYENHRKELLARRGEQATNYPSSVAITWSLSFKKVNQANPAAAELLRLCAFLAPDKIPEELIQDGAANWSPLLQQAATDLFTFNQMVEELLKFSLVKRLVETRMLSIHRLVQAVQMDTMEPTEQRQWAERVVRAVNDVFPSNSDDVAAIWPQCLRYLSQVQVCYDLVGLYTLMLIEAARLLNRTSIYLWHQALYTIAEPLIQRALLIYEQQLGPDHPNTASSLHNLADLYRSQGKYAEAEPLYQRALSICEQQMGTEHPTTAVMLNSLANLYEIQGKYAEAELLCQRALTIHEQQFGPDHLGITISLSSLANLYESQGKYAEAELLHQRALLICEQQLRPLHPQMASHMDNLARLYEKRSKYEEAELLHQRALTIRKQQLGPDHPDTATSLNNLAALYWKLGKYAEAEPLYRRTLAICEQQLGPDHPNTASSLSNLAALCESQGKYAEAELLYRRALAIYEQQLGTQHSATATILNNLGNLYYDQGKYAEAEPLWQRALTIRKQQLGPDHPDTATSLNNLAALYWNQGKYEGAEPLYRCTLAIDIQTFGADHPEVATDLNNLANLYKRQGKYVEAEPLYQRALSIYEQQLGRDHLDTQTVRENYATLLRALGRDGATKELEERS